MSLLTASTILFAIVLAGLAILGAARSHFRAPNKLEASRRDLSYRRMLGVVSPITVLAAFVLGIWLVAWLASQAVKNSREAAVAALMGLAVSLFGVVFPLASRLYKWGTATTVRSIGQSVMLPASYWASEGSLTALGCGFFGAMSREWGTGALFVVIPVAVGFPPLYRALVGPLFLRKKMRGYLAMRSQGQRSEHLVHLQTWVDELAVRYRLKTAPPLIPEEGLRTFAVEALRPEAAIFVSEKLLAGMTVEERKGLIAHEFAHILRRERLRRALVEALVTSWYIGLFAWWMYRHAGTTLGAQFVWLIVYAYVRQAVRTALSRRSEFAADKLAAEIVGDSRPIAGMVQKMATISRIPLNRATSTHPSPAARIAALGSFS
jgi:Zn-dependent protease with chaperone function